MVSKDPRYWLKWPRSSFVLLQPTTLHAPAPSVQPKNPTSHRTGPGRPQTTRRVPAAGGGLSK
eukprot:5085872-Prymnesium_polylepis.2